MTPERIADRESVWEQIAEKCPQFLSLRPYFDNHHPVREIVLGGSVTWAGVHQRWRPIPGMRVMDVGANVGVFSAYTAIHGCRVTAYEPFLKLYERLRCLPIGGIGLDAKHAAIWTVTGKTMYLGTESKVGDCPAFNGSIPTDGVKWNEADHPDKVDSIAFAEALGEEIWDFVKMDIEGAECEVLLATPEEKLRQIKFLYVEFHPWVNPLLEQKAIIHLQKVFQVECAYWNAQIGRWEGAYCRL